MINPWTSSTKSRLRYLTQRPGTAFEGFLFACCVAITATPGCRAEETAAQPGAEPGTNLPDKTQTRRSTSALSINNALQVNGLSNNGMYVNGLSFNSMVPNGLYVNGLPLNGLPLNGLYVNGLYVNGIGPNGLPVNGLPLNGLYVNGLPLNGLPLNGLPLNGLYVNGLPLNGLYVNGLPVNGLPLNGLPLNGLYVNGLPLNGLYVNGLYPNGLYVNGLPLNGLPLNGLYVNGVNPATAIKVADTSGELVALSADQETAFESMIGHLVWCALPEGQSVTIYRSTGQAKAYPGHHNLAPAWATSGLVDDPSGIDDSEELRWCVEHYRATTNDGSVSPGIALNAQQQADLKVLLKYTVSCALDAGDSVDIAFPSGPVTFYGALGLAPSWKTGALDANGQKIVSACLGARTNALGNTVRISLRGPYESLATSPVERAQFRHHEGAFWGNVFGETPAFHVCRDQGGGPAGRLCTDGSCGFSPMPIPSCAEAINGGCEAKDAEGNWTSCGDSHETQVLNTYLMTETRVSGMNTHGCAVRASGELWCWGQNGSGQLGFELDSASPRADVHQGKAVENLPDQGQPANRVRAVTANADTTCSILHGGEVWCWGDNRGGQLGDGSSVVDRVTPGRVDDLSNQAASISSGWGHLCAVKMDGSLWCWGDNQFGQLGDGTTDQRSRPVKILEDVVNVGAGPRHTCAIKLDGTLWCWGDNAYSELGDGTTIIRLNPIQVTALGDHAIDVVAGNRFTCARKDDLTAWCWGRNDHGQVGRGGPFTSTEPTPAQVALAHPVLQIAAGSDHACALDDQANLYCWGSNEAGQLGVGEAWYDPPGSSSPQPVINPTESPALEIQSGGSSNFALREDGSISVWGMDFGAVLGMGYEALFFGLVDGKGTLFPARPYPESMHIFVDSEDGVCDISESPQNEPTCARVGDGLCTGDETCATAPGDCESTFYLDADGDGYGSGNSLTVCPPPPDYVLKSGDCDDANAARYPYAQEYLDGLDNNCNGVADEGYRLNPDYTFAGGVGAWTASAGTLSASTSGCYNGNNCIMLKNKKDASVEPNFIAGGLGEYNAVAYVSAKSGSITAYLEIEERTSSGILVGTTQSASATTGSSYTGLFATRVVTDPTHTVTFRVWKIAGNPMRIDNAYILRW
ncbi:MAG: hypothetical protein H6729_02170 [Deltaproteobacteria bacterium]|nr:hypothetical protein [Deltaproteobacteria bacterium]